MFRATVLVALIIAQVTAAPVVMAAVVDACETDGIQYDCTREDIRIREINPIYDNGLEGNVNASNFTQPHQTWPSEVEGVPIPEGVMVSPQFDSLARVFTAYNGTAGPNGTLTPPGLDATGGHPTNLGPALQILQFTVNVSPSIIMNGASSWYYRSPIEWDANFTRHYLNVYDDSGLLAASAVYGVDSGNNTELVNGRLYYKIEAMFEGGRDYTFKEFVKTSGDFAVSHLDVHLAPGQDVDGNGDRSFRAFVGKDAERIVEEELAFSLKFIQGMGSGGGNFLLRPGDDIDEMQIVIPGVSVRNHTSGADQATFVLPLKSSVPISGEITTSGVFLHPSADPITFSGVTGTLIIDAALASFPDAVVDVTITIRWDATANCPSNAHGDCAVTSYPMSRTSGLAGHAIVAQNTTYGYSTTTPIQWVPWLEVVAEDIPSPVTVQDSSVTESSNLLSVALILAGIVLFAGALIIFPVSIPFAIGATVIGAASIVIGSVTLDAESAAALVAAAEDLAALAALAACGGAFIAPGIGTKLALGGACVLLGAAATGNLPELLDFVLRIVEIVKAAVEKLGALLSSAAEWLVPLAIAIAAMTLIFVFLGTLVVPLKYVIMGVTGLLAVIMYEKATDWHVYRRVRNIPIPLFTQLVENKFFGMKVPV